MTACLLSRSACYVVKPQLSFHLLIQHLLIAAAILNRIEWLASCGVTAIDLPRLRHARYRRIRAAKNIWITRLAFALAAIALFVAYLGQARTMPTMSDGASQELQAWAMLHGNVLLRGWSLSDVSFYTTELPEYMLVEILRGLTPGVVQIAAALTYTALVLLAGLLAKGSATGREGLIRMLIASGIMLAPALGSLNTTFVVLAYPDHTGTQVPLLATWLLIDRVRPRWWVPVVVTAALAWVQIADTMALYEAALPLAGVCLVRMYRRRGPLGGQWYELALGVGAIASIGMATLALRLIRLTGGFAVRTPGAGFARASGLDSHLWVKVEHILVLFGADFFGLSLTSAVAPLIHLAGFALALVGAAVAARRFFADNELTVQILTASFLMVLVSFFFGFRLGAWEAVALLPIGAVLAGRMLAGRLIARRLVTALAVVLACYSAFLLYDATRPAPFSPNQRVATWLTAHHLRYGLASYWEASSVTVDSDNYVQVRPIRTTTRALLLTHWNAEESWYDPHLHDARFVIFRYCKGCLSLATLRSVFGPPAHVYRVVHYRVLVWNKNLLRGRFVSGPQVSWDILADGDSSGRYGAQDVHAGRPDYDHARQAGQADRPARSRRASVRDRRALLRTRGQRDPARGLRRLRDPAAIPDRRGLPRP